MHSFLLKEVSIFSQMSEYSVRKCPLSSTKFLLQFGTVAHSFFKAFNYNKNIFFKELEKKCCKRVFNKDNAVS